MPLHFTLIGVDFPSKNGIRHHSLGECNSRATQLSGGHPALVPEILMAHGAGAKIKKGSLAGQVALVTGSSQGIGAALALALADAGAAVRGFRHCRFPKTALQIKDRGGQAVSTKADVTDNQSLAALVAAPSNTSVRSAYLSTTPACSVRCHSSH